jgi:Tfp pilus assembly protein PilV
MIPSSRKKRAQRGVTLTGALVAVVVLLIALIGTSTFRYTAALDGRRANAQITAARVALLLCESWRGLKGDETHDPIQLAGGDFEVKASTWDGHVTPDGYTLLGNYEIVMDSTDADSFNYYATLSWKDVKAGLRALNVNVAWARRSESEQGAQDVDKSYALTVYTQTN